MSYLIVSQLSKAFGAETVFQDVTFQIGAGERVALVGPNGAGKTTLLNIIGGRLRPDTGQVSIARKARLCYVAQENDPELEGTVMGIMFDTAQEITALRQQLARYEQQMADPELRNNPELLEKLMEKYSRLQQKYELKGGYQLETRIKTILTGLGLPEETWGNRVAELSGGQRVRLNLARVLVQQPDILILDEPTNHLDIEAIEWLEQFLLKFSGAVLVVSHDRYFLDCIATHILELESGKIKLYRGNYSTYAQQKELRYVTRMKQYRQNVRKAEQLRKLIAKNKVKASKARQAKNWEKRLDRLDLERPKLSDHSLKLRFEVHRRGGDEVLDLEDVTHGFEERLLFSGFTAFVRRGARIALVGPNGCGKTTLLRLIMQELAPCSGSVRLGRSVKIGYFDQDLSMLDEELSLLEQVQRWSGMLEREARAFLARYRFTGDDVFKKIAVLSGGERNRLIMARLFLHGPNVLILDEPTNHLDLWARHALEEALKQFEGTLLFVSHDRYFLQKLANRFWYFHEGKILDFQGSYSDFQEWRAEQLATKRQSRTEKQASPRPVERKKKPQIDPLQELEERIARLEADKQELEQLFAGNTDFGDPEVVAVVKRYQELLDELDALYDKWEQLALERNL